MSVIEIETLLDEIEATAPCGEDLEYDPELAELEAAAQETPERQYGDTIIPAQPPDWRAVKTTALSLFGRTRDLRIAVALARALLHVDGLPGFAAGLSVVAVSYTHLDVYKRQVPHRPCRSAAAAGPT